MSDYDLPTETSPPPEQIAYPEIDETLHYPWQSSQQSNVEPVTSVIDPRLYHGLLSQDDVEREEEDREAEDSEVAEDFEAYHPQHYGPGDEQDSDFVYTENESER